MSARACKHCGGAIGTDDRRAVYCSDNCRKRFWENNTEQRAHCAECGAPLSVRSLGRSKRCVPCDYARRAESYRTIEQLWAEGRTIREIAAHLSTTKETVSVAITRMRAQGYDLPYRRSTFPTGKPRFPNQVAA